MCGIWSILSKNNLQLREKQLTKLYNEIQGRGPEVHTLEKINNKLWLGFHRLKINDVSKLGNQPFIIKESNESIEHYYYLICNGEIYNHSKLSHDNDIVTNSTSDCEVIIHLYKKIGIKETLKLLDGVFAGVIVLVALFGVLG